MVKFFIGTALVATLGAACLGNLNEMAQKVLNSGKTAFGGHAKKVDSLSREGENSPYFEQGTARAAFGGVTVQPATASTITTMPSPQSGQQTTRYFVQSRAPQPLPQNSQEFSMPAKP